MNTPEKITLAPDAELAPMIEDRLSTVAAAVLNVAESGNNGLAR